MNVRYSNMCKLVSFDWSLMDLPVDCSISTGHAQKNTDLKKKKLAANDYVIVK